MWQTLRWTILAVSLCFGGVAHAETNDEVLLTVTLDGSQIALTRSELEDIDMSEIETTTIWTEGQQVFTGVSLFRLMEELDVTEGLLLASAINDYTVEVPLSDAVMGGAMIAYHNNGNAMSVRDKGPLWLVYPFDSDPIYQTEVIYSRSIWQLDRIEVVN